MPVARVGGVELFYELRGAGEPVVLVHGSWADHHHWDPVLAPLSESFQVVAYDRHGQSGRPAGQGSVHEDADDLAGLIESLDRGPADVVANSFGSIVAMHASIRRPEVFATLIAHEPPLVGLLAGSQFEAALPEIQQRTGRVIERLEAGDDEAGAKLFVDTIARRPGAWDSELTPELRQVFISNAQTFLDEARDPDSRQVNLDQLRQFDRPGLLTKGTASPPFLGAVVDMIGSALPVFQIEAIEGADHAPHQTTQSKYVEVIEQFSGRST